MKKQGGGAVVMINTMTTLKPFGGEGPYASSKAALSSATKYMAIELGPSNIRVNRIVTDDQCARAALLISDYASAVSGAVLDANGGEGLP